MANEVDGLVRLEIENAHRTRMGPRTSAGAQDVGQV